MKKGLLKIISLTSFVMISLMIIIYSSLRISPITNKLNIVLGCIGLISQIFIMILIYLDFNNIIKKSIVTGLIVCEIIASVMCIISGNNLLGTSLIILFFAIIYFYPKIKSIIDLIKKKKSFKKILKYISANYPNAEIYKKDNNYKSFNGKSIKFYLGEGENRKVYRIFIDSQGNITDMHKVFKENNIEE